MQRTHNPLPFAASLGLIPGNPFAPFVIGGFVGGIGVFLLLLFLVFFGATTETRFHAGLGLIFVGGIVPIPLALLVIVSRGYLRIQRVLAGDYLVHWRYTPSDPHFNRPGSEVYIGYQGIYWPARRFRLIDFKSGLKHIQITADEMVFHYLERRYTRTMTYTLEREVRVPIPTDRREEAQSLAEMLQKRQHTPSESLNDQWVIAWIMGGTMIGLVVLAALLVTPTQFRLWEEESDARATLMAPTFQARAALLQAGWERINRVIEPQLETLRAAGARVYRPETLGFLPSDNVREVVVGFCRLSEDFYVLVWEKQPTVQAIGFRVGVFHYVDGEWLEGCMPPQWQPDGLNTVTDDWNYVYVVASRSYLATLWANEFGNRLTPTPIP